MVRSFPGFPIAFERTSREALERLRRAAVPRLVLSGLLPKGSAWERLLDASLASPSSRSLTFFTGLLVRPRAGTWLRLTSGANRRSTLFEIDETTLSGEEGFVR